MTQSLKKFVIAVNGKPFIKGFDKGEIPDVRTDFKFKKFKPKRCKMGMDVGVVTNTVLCSAFPGTGKTHCFFDPYSNVLDSDSSKFDKANFPQNYIDHIKSNIGKVEIIFISSHKAVRDALVKNNLEFVLVYPEINLKDEYLDRYKKRSNTDKFVKLLDNNWDKWIKQLQKQKGCKHIVLKSNEFISDINLGEKNEN